MRESPPFAQGVMTLVRGCSTSRNRPICGSCNPGRAYVGSRLGKACVAVRAAPFANEACYASKVAYDHDQVDAAVPDAAEGKLRFQA